MLFILHILLFSDISDLLFLIRHCLSDRMLQVLHLEPQFLQLFAFRFCQTVYYLTLLLQIIRLLPLNLFVSIECVILLTRVLQLYTLLRLLVQNAYRPTEKGQHSLLKRTLFRHLTHQLFYLFLSTLNLLSRSHKHSLHASTQLLNFSRI